MSRDGSPIQNPLLSPPPGHMTNVNRPNPVSLWFQGRGSQRERLRSEARTRMGLGLFRCGLDVLRRGHFLFLGVHMYVSHLQPARESAASPLHRLLTVSRFHRLHPGLALVGLVGLDSGFVLDLRWWQVDVVGSRVDYHGESRPLPPTVSGLLQWHHARQRLDKTLAIRWFASDQVLVDRCGKPFSVDSADVAMRWFCEQLGLPSIPFSSLRHPCLR